MSAAAAAIAKRDVPATAAATNDSDVTSNSAPTGSVNLLTQAPDLSQLRKDGNPPVNMELADETDSDDDVILDLPDLKAKLPMEKARLLSNKAFNPLAVEDETEAKDKGFEESIKYATEKIYHLNDEIKALEKYVMDDSDERMCDLRKKKVLEEKALNLLINQQQRLLDLERKEAEFEEKRKNEMSKLGSNMEKIAEDVRKHKKGANLESQNKNNNNNNNISSSRSQKRQTKTKTKRKSSPKTRKHSETVNNILGAFSTKPSNLGANQANLGGKSKVSNNIDEIIIESSNSRQFAGGFNKLRSGMYNNNNNNNNNQNSSELNNGMRGNEQKSENNNNNNNNNNGNIGQASDTFGLGNAANFSFNSLGNNFGNVRGADFGPNQSNQGSPYQINSS